MAVHGAGYSMNEAKLMLEAISVIHWIMREHISTPPTPKANTSGW